LKTCLPSRLKHLICRVGQDQYIYGAYTVFLAGKSPNIRSNTVYIYSSGQPYLFASYAYIYMVMATHVICRVGQNRVHTPYMTVYFVIFDQKYRVYTVYMWSWQPMSPVGLARTVCIHRITVYDCIFGDFLAKNTAYTPYIYGHGNPCHL